MPARLKGTSGEAVHEGIRPLCILSDKCDTAAWAVTLVSVKWKDNSEGEFGPGVPDDIKIHHFILQQKIYGSMVRFVQATKRWACTTDYMSI